MRKKRILLVGIILNLCILMTGCGVLEQLKSSPEKTVYGFFTAINKKDINKALEYIEPSQSKGVTAVLSLAGDFIGLDLNTLLDTLPLFSSVMEESEGELVEFQYEITGVEEYEDEAWVTGIEHVTGEEMAFYLVKEDGTWYIYMDDF